MTSQFPLLRLPLLALDVVFENLEIHERYHLSRASKKLCNILRHFHACCDRYFDLYVSFREYHEMRVLRTNSKSNGFFDRWESDPKHIPNYKRQLSYVSYLFKDPQVNLFFDKKNPTLILDILEYVEQMQLKIVKINVTSSSPSDELCQKILETYRDLKFLRVACETGPNFRLISEIPFRATNLEILHAKWMTRENLKLFHGCKNVRFVGVQLTHPDFVDFFKQWCLGSEIEHMEASYKGTVLDALGETPSIAVNRIKIMDDVWNFNAGRAYVIKNIHGIEGCVFTVGGFLAIVKHFEIVDD